MVHVQSPKRYECNRGFDLSVINDVVYEISYWVFKGVSKVGALLRSTVIRQFKRELNVKDACSGMRGCKQSLDLSEAIMT